MIELVFSNCHPEICSYSYLAPYAGCKYRVKVLNCPVDPSREVGSYVNNILGIYVTT